MPLPAEPGRDAAVGQRVERRRRLALTRVARYARPRVAPALVALVIAFAVPFLAPDGMRAALLGSHADEPAAIARVTADEHLDEAVPARFARFVAGIAHGDFGRSYVQDLDVERELLTHGWVTLLLVVLAWFLTRGAFGAATAFGVLAIEAAAGIPGLGTLLADAVDVRDVVMIRAVLVVVLLGCVLLPRPRRGPRLHSPAHQARPLPADVPPVITTAAWVWLFVVALAVAFAYRLPIADPDALGVRHALPSWSHWFGTDDVGRDVLARVVWAAQGSLLYAVASTVAGFAIGAIAGALVAEAPRAQRVVAWWGRAGIAAVGVSVALVAVARRQPFTMWEYLVPLTVAPAIAWAARAFATGAPAKTRSLPAALAALGLAVASAMTGEAVLGALGLVPEDGLTWGVLLNDVRRADHRSWTELTVVLAVVIATVAALYAVARSLAPRSVPRTADPHDEWLLGAPAS
jgi:peptide/nickel transport system permease protein